MNADGGAVIGAACRDTKFLCCSILLTHGNFTNLADAFTGDKDEEAAN
jgi:hypothetical protein